MKVFTLREAAEVARVSETLLRRQIREGVGPAVVMPGKVGGRRMLVTDGALTDWFTSRTLPAGSILPKTIAKQ
jgi:hypothetical protein